MFDKEKSGTVYTSQVAQILRTMGQPFEDSDLKNVVKEFDPDGKPSNSWIHLSLDNFFPENHKILRIRNAGV